MPWLNPLAAKHWMRPLFLQPAVEAMRSITDAEPAQDGASPPPPGRSSRQFEPLDLLMLVMTFAACLWVIDPIYDVNDVFWHILLGDQMRSGTPFAELGSAFSYSVDNPDWRTGAWLSEYLMSWLYDLGGWTLLVNVIRLGSIAGVSFVFWRHLVRRWPSRAVLLPYLLSMAALALTVQERPQSISYVFIALTGVWWFHSVLDHRPPHWLLVGLTAALWANLHGLWVVLPSVLALAFVGRLLNNGFGDSLRTPMAAAFLASIVGGCLTPLGLSGLLLAARVQDSAKNLISEWEPTTLAGWPGYFLLIAGALALYLLGRVPGTSRAEVLLVVAVGAFGLAAQRNVSPALLLIAPLLTSLIVRALGIRAQVVVSTRERTRLMVTASVLAVAGVLATGLTIGLREQGPPNWLPVALASRLAEEPGQVRLLNEYNMSGVALFYGGDSLQVGADGRADYYGSEFLTRYHDAVSKGRDTLALAEELQPTHALIAKDSPSAAILQADGWTVMESDEDYTLLVAP